MLNLMTLRLTRSYQKSAYPIMFHYVNWYTHYAPRTMSVNQDSLSVGLALLRAGDDDNVFAFELALLPL
jgi:hypothetical protein